jgi:hypothetical protein
MAAAAVGRVRARVWLTVAGQLLFGRRDAPKADPAARLVPRTSGARVLFRRLLWPAYPLLWVAVAIWLISTAYWLVPQSRPPSAPPVRPSPAAQ